MGLGFIPAGPAQGLGRDTTAEFIHPCPEEDRLPVMCCAALTVGGLSLEVGAGAQGVMEAILSKL